MSHTWIEDGGVTTPLGFEAGGTYAGIKKFGDAKDRKDVGLLVARKPCVATGLFTTNRVCGAPVTVSREHLAGRSARAIVVNSGCSNVAMGERGIEDARAMASSSAKCWSRAPVSSRARSRSIACAKVSRRSRPRARVVSRSVRPS